MSKIAIESNVKLQFPPANFGFVEIKIDLIQNKKEQGVYELRLVDTCFDIVDDERVVLNSLTRFKTYSYEEIGALSQAVNVDFTDPTKRVEQINEIFSKGLLAVTQQECLGGISGVVNKGMYFSSATNWILAP